MSTRNDIPTQHCLIKSFNRFGGSAEVAGTIECCQDYLLDCIDDTTLQLYTNVQIPCRFYPNEHMFTQMMPLIVRIDPAAELEDSTCVMYCADYNGEPAVGSKKVNSAYVIVGSLPVGATKQTQFFTIDERAINLAYDDTTLVTQTVTLTAKAGVLDLVPLFTWAAGNANLGVSGVAIDATGAVWANTGVITITPKTDATLGQGPQLVLNESVPVGRLTLMPFDTTPDTNTYYNNKYDVVITTESETPATSLTFKIRAVYSGV